MKEEPDLQGSKVEMVTVPALGAEWGKDELYSATKAGKREKRLETRKEFWKAWNRGERGLCGRYFTRKVLIWFLFGLCCAYVLSPLSLLPLLILLINLGLVLSLLSLFLVSPPSLSMQHLLS